MTCPPCNQKIREVAGTYRDSVSFVNAIHMPIYASDFRGSFCNMAVCPTLFLKNDVRAVAVLVGEEDPEVA
jgi:hypothetical protein